MPLRATRSDWTPKKRAVAVALRKEGMTYEKIAERLRSSGQKNATKSGVRKLCMRFEARGVVATAKGRGRKKVTSPKDDRMIVRLAIRDRCKSSKAIKLDLESAGIVVSAPTIRRILVRAGLRARKRLQKPLLNPEQRRKRVVWARDHLGWTPDDWRQVLWSDETRISIFGSDGIRYVRRRPNEAHIPECTKPTVKHPTSVMIWGCMAQSGIGRIVVLDGTVNAERYLEEVLKRPMLLSAADIFGPGGEFIFQQDGAPCHTAKKVMTWCKMNHITVMDWPGNSPDLNPIENLWSRLKRLVALEKPTTRRTLIEAILKCWNHAITPNDLNRLVDSMHRRCKAVVAARGYATRY